jgi:flavocytochrome c
VPIRLGSHVTDLIQDDRGRVIGVNVKSKSGASEIISASKGVVVASGGFGADIPFRSAQDPRLDGSILSTNLPSATADLLKECMRIGANPVQLSRIQLGPWTCPDEKGFGIGPLFGEYILLPFGVLLNAETGRRFVNELGNRKHVADALLEQKTPAIGIADTQGLEASGVDLSPAIRRGIVQTFDSIEAVAAFYHLNPTTLENTIKHFNQMFLEKTDTEYGKPLLKQAAPIVKAPFYAMRVWPKVHFTMGGIQIDTSARVIHRDQRPIPGLFAAGEVTGGVHGASRLSCCAITECIVMGKVAGITASMAI